MRRKALAISMLVAATVATLLAATPSDKLRLFAPKLTNAGLIDLATSIVTGVLPIAHVATGTPDGTKFVRDDGTLAVPPGTGTGTVTHTGTLTANRLILGNGSADITALGSLGTTTTLLHGNASGAPTFGAVSLSADVTGTLPVGNGGTGLTSGTSGGVLYFSGSTTLASSAALTANDPVIGGGAGSAPTVGTRSGNTTTFATTTGSLTSGNCVKFDASGNLADTGASCGTGAGSSLGGFVLIESHTASSSATLDFTTCISSTYDEYEIKLLNVVPATNTAILSMRMSTDGGSTYDTSNLYSFDLYAFRAAGSANYGGTAQNTINLIYAQSDGVSSNTSWGVVGHVSLYSPGSTSVYKQIEGQVRYLESSVPARLGAVVTGAYESTTAVNAFRFLFSTGNIASGIIRCYGLAK